MMLAHIPLDVITYVIAPYLHVSAAINTVVYSVTQPSKLLAQVVYNQPHGIVRDRGSTCHYVNGKVHRDDGPAYYDSHWYSAWWWRDQRHRIGGPAMTCPAYSEWWQFGKRHRLDGPAIEYKSGYKEWHIENHRYYSVSEYEAACIAYK